MITVKLYGLLRIESGIKDVQLDAKTVKDILDHLASRGISPKELAGCIILINGKNASRRSKLADGDQVVLMSPVAGG